MSITPEQFNKLAMKDDLSNYMTKDKLEKKFDQVLTAVDGVMHKLDIIEHAFVSNQAAHDRFKQRITKIEEHLNLKSSTI